MRTQADVPKKMNISPKTFRIDANNGREMVREHTFKLHFWLSEPRHKPVRWTHYNWVSRVKNGVVMLA
jgi:hypothetical protein